jgi:hypothetical protein
MGIVQNQKVPLILPCFQKCPYGLPSTHRRHYVRSSAARLQSACAGQVPCRRRPAQPVPRRPPRPGGFSPAPPPPRPGGVSPPPPPAPPPLPPAPPAPGEFFLGYTQYGIYKLVISIAFTVLGFLDLGFISTLIGLLNYVWWVALLAMAVLTFMGKWIYEKDASGVPTV